MPPLVEPAYPPAHFWQRAPGSAFIDPPRMVASQLVGASEGGHQRHGNKSIRRASFSRAKFERGKIRSWDHFEVKAQINGVAGEAPHPGQPLRPGLTPCIGGSTQRRSSCGHRQHGQSRGLRARRASSVPGDLGSCEGEGARVIVRPKQHCLELMIGKTGVIGLAQKAQS